MMSSYLNYHERHTPGGGRNPGPDLGGFCAPGTTWLDRHVQVSPTVALRVVSFTPASTGPYQPAVLVPGLSSTMLTFRNILVELTLDHTVHYVETREKPTSVITGPTAHGIESLGADIVGAVAALGLEDSRYILFGSSSSATAAIDCCEHLTPRPRYMVLLEPNAVFDYPQWSLYVIGIGPPFYQLIKPVAKWYLRTFRVNMREDATMYAINTRALDSADPYKLRDAILAIASYRIWDRLPTVDIPCVVVCASRDTMHKHSDIEKIVSRIPTAAFWDLETHAKTHSRELVDRLRKHEDLM